MMTEEKKAEALEAYNRALLNNGEMSTWFRYFEKVIVELLQPAPFEQEVDGAVEELKYFMDESKLDSDDYYADVRDYIETLIRAAQRPRQEWRTMDDANKAIDYQLITDRDILDHMALSENDKHHTLGCISGLMTAKQFLQPLPEPPEVTG